jgi:hypothetical protein
MAEGICMSEASRAYGEGRDPLPAIAEPTIVFMINKSLPPGSWTDEDVYRTTRYSWKIGNDAREQAVYALGVSHGVVRGAYRIESWHQADGNRWYFAGNPAPELDVVGKALPGLRLDQAVQTRCGCFWMVSRRHLGTDQHISPG